MFTLLFDMGVQPEALLLPRRPDQGRCRLCQPDSLAALIDTLVERCNKDLSRHKEVMRAVHPCLILCSCTFSQTLRSLEGRAFSSYPGQLRTCIACGQLCDPLSPR